MALQPDIALGIKPPPAVDFTKFAQLRNLASQDQLLQEEIATQQAARPGIEADVAVKQRALGFNRWMSENGGKFMKEDGSVDHPALVRAATGVGYSNEARTIAKTDIDRTSATIKNATDQIASDNAKLNLGLKTLAYGGHFFSNLPEDQQGMHLGETVTQLNKMAPGTGDQFAAVVTLKDPKTGKPRVDANGRPVIDKAMVDALKLSGMSAETQEQLAQAGSSNNTDKDARDPNSEKSRAAARAAINAGVPDVVEGKTSLSSLNNNALYKDLVAASVIPAQYKAEGSNAADKLKVDANSMGSAASLIEQLIASGDLKPGNKVASIFNMAVDKVTNKAAFAAAVALLTKIKQDYPTVNLETGDGPSVAAALRALQITTMNGAGQMSKRTGKSTFNQLDTGTPTNETVPPEALTPKGPQQKAPQKAIEALAKDPSLAPQFKAKYGYLP